MGWQVCKTYLNFLFPSAPTSTSRNVVQETADATPSHRKMSLRIALAANYCVSGMEIGTSFV